MTLTESLHEVSATFSGSLDEMSLSLTETPDEVSQSFTASVDGINTQFTELRVEGKDNSTGTNTSITEKKHSGTRYGMDTSRMWTEINKIKDIDKSTSDGARNGRRNGRPGTNQYPGSKNLQRKPSDKTRLMTGRARDVTNTSKLNMSVVRVKRSHERVKTLRLGLSVGHISPTVGKALV